MPGGILRGQSTIDMLPADRAAPGAWQAVDPATGAGWFSTLEVPWWIAGGRALDLYLGRQCRAHADLDVGVLRRDIMTVLAALSSWEIFEAKDGALTRLGVGEVPRSAVHSLWCRPTGTTLWRFELMLDESIFRTLRRKSNFSTKHGGRERRTRQTFSSSRLGSMRRLERGWWMASHAQRQGIDG